MTVFQRAKTGMDGEHGRRSRRLVGAMVGFAAIGSLVGTVILPEVASASAPSSVTFSPGSTTGNTVSTWTIGLTPSPSGALGTSNTISVIFNPNFSAANGQTVIFGGFGAGCPSANDFVNGNVATVTLPAGCSLAGSASGTLSIPGITNPGAGTYPNTSFSVATSQDTSAVSTGANITIGTASSTASATVLTASPSPTPPVSQVTVTASVSPATATGTVTFFNNGSPISGCTAVALTAAVANCSTSYTSVGNTSYVAVYSGNASLTGSTSAALVPVAQTQTLTHIQLRKSSDPYGLETRQRISVDVTTLSGGPTTVAGVVKVMAGNQALCVINLASNAGRCGLKARQLAGHHTYRIYAVFQGTTTFTKSTSDNQLYRIIGG